MQRKRIAILSAVAVAALIAAVLSGGATAQGPQDSVGAGQIGTPNDFKPGYSSQSGYSDRSGEAYNSLKLEGKSADELGQEISKGACPFRDKGYYGTLPRSRMGTNITIGYCTGIGKTETCHSRRYYCDGERWVLQ